MKKLFLKCIIRLPGNFLRVFCYKYLLKYNIGRNTRIGKAVINCNYVEIGENVTISGGNTFSCNSLKIGNNTSIFSGNIFQGKSNFTIGENSRIINNHYFDLWNNISVGDRTWIAGRGSQFWTHGSTHTKQGIKELSIVLKNDIYLGSGTNIAPGVTIESNNLIGLGSVLTKDFLQKNTIIGGNPANVIKTEVDWRENW
jgi:acetyltransferase-like isoleucine patch superfamily enzyme